MSDGTIYPDIMVIGTAPGFYDNLYKKPFVGKSGQLLREAFTTIGATSVYYTNMVKCMPDYGKCQTKAQEDICSNWIDEELLLIKPSVILAVGVLPSKYLLTNNRFGVDIKNFNTQKHRGIAYNCSNGVKIISTWHTDQILSCKTEAYDLWEDVQLAYSLTSN